jgi:hypothetical protein
VGALEAPAQAGVEALLRYHPVRTGTLTQTRYPGRGQRQAGSLTGAVASQNVTEARKGSLSTGGNRA